jgi:hypothetical protein
MRYNDGVENVSSPFFFISVSQEQTTDCYPSLHDVLGGPYKAFRWLSVFGDGRENCELITVQFSDPSVCVVPLTQTVTALNRPVINSKLRTVAMFVIINI